MRALFAVTLLALLLTITDASAQFAALSSRGAAPAKTVTLTANVSVAGFTIPSNFIGYSINTSSLINGYLTGSGSLCSLAGMVGSNGVLRIGGLDQDTTPSAPPLTQNMANGLEALRACLGSGWQLIYGLDAVINNSAVAASQAQLLQTASGSNMIFQFGNEPIDGGNFTVSSYQTMWNSYYAAVIGAIPAAKFASWDDNNYNQTRIALNGLTPGVAGLTYVTQHYYNGPCASNSGSTGSEPASILIGQLLMNLYPTVGSTFFLTGIPQNVLWAGSVPTRLAETNTICSGGALGSSDALMASAWFLNMGIVLSNAGYNGVNIHNNFWWPASGGTAVVGDVYPNIYGPLQLNGDGTFSPGPEFYGMLLFSKIEGQQTVQLGVAGNANINAIATKGGNGNANILIVNNDQSLSVAVTPTQINSWSSATVLSIVSSDGLNCSSKSPLLGGAAIGVSGAWSGSSYTISNGQSLQLPPCGAALVQIQP